MEIKRSFLTFDEFTIRQYRSIPNATGELSNLLRDIGLAGKRINAEVNKAGLADILGDAGETNIQGEDVKKLDLFANHQLTEILRHGISCAGVASEEMDDIVVFNDDISNKSKYVLLFDPVDGSGNIDVNCAIGTIFGVYRRVTKIGTPCSKEDFLQAGKKQVAAGYIIYGSSTIYVYATRRGINGFTLDPAIGEFCLSHPDIKCPAQGKTFSTNLGYYNQYSDGVRNYIKACQQKTKDNGGPYMQRYTGSMVADLHRNLIRGGIFLYPATEKKKNGKLRLLYECNPLAFIYEVAGAKACSVKDRILDIVPAKLHQRTPLFIGSKNMIEELEDYIRKYDYMDEEAASS